MPTTINIFPPNAFVISQSSGATYDLLAANVVTGVVTSSVLPANTTTFLTVRLQALLAALPGLSSTALQSLIRNLVGLNQLEGTFTAAVGVVGNVYTLTLSGLHTPSSMQVSIGFSMISPFMDDGSNAGGGSGGSGVTTLAVVDTNTANANDKAGSIVGATLTLNVAGSGFPGVMSNTDKTSLDSLGVLSTGGFTTPDNTPVDWTITDLANVSSTVNLVEAYIVAATSDAAKSAGYIIAGTFLFDVGGGTVTQIGSTVPVLVNEVDSSWGVAFVVVGTQVIVRVVGDAAVQVTWQVRSQNRTAAAV